MVDFSDDKFNVVDFADEGAEMIVVDADGVQMRDDSGYITITVRGMDSPTVRSVARKISQKRARGVKMSDEAVTMALAVAATKSWSGIENADGPLECVADNIEWLYRRVPLIYDQVQEFAIDRANFTRE